MFKIIVFIGLSFFSALTISAKCQVSNNELLSEIREKLPDAFMNEDSCSYLLQKVKNIKNVEPLLKGYVGGVFIAQSKHAPLFDKLQALKTGTEMLEEAIKEKPNNIELLFLRLSIQLNLPGFLKYNDNIEKDKAFVLKNFSQALPILKSRIINFVKSSGFFTEEEQQHVVD